MMNPNTNTNLRKNKMAANEKIKAILEISWGHNFTNGLEYITRHEVVFCFIF